MNFKIFSPEINIFDAKKLYLLPSITKIKQWDRD